MQFLSRRAALKAALATGVIGGTSAMVDMPCASAGQSTGSKPIKIGAIDPLSGPYAQVGMDGIKGGKIEAKHLGKLVGRDIDFLSYDSKGDVAESRRIINSAMHKQGAKFFFGAASSAVALAVADVTNQNRGVFITGAGADELTGTECRKSTFRWSLPTYGAVRETVLPMIKNDPSLKRWYTITPNYVFGQSLLKNCKAVLKENGAKLVGNSFHSLNETNFTSYIENAIAAKPDVLVLLNFGSQTTAALKEAISYGAKKRMKILTVWAAGLDQYEALGAESMEGLYFGCQYWHGIDTNVNKTFVDMVMKETGSPPNYPMALGFVGFQLLGLGMKNAGSTDPEKVVAALEGLTYDGLTGNEKIESENHQVVKQYYLLKGKGKSKMADKFDYVDIVSHGASVVPLSENACHMQSWKT